MDIISYTQSPLLSSLRYRIPGPEHHTRQAICNQLMIGIQEFYTHLPQKMSHFGFDPVAQLRALKANSQGSFTRRLLKILSQFHDRHTTLRLPEPWSRMVAYLPFVVERVYDQKRPQYILTKHMFGFEDIPIGSVMTHWNGTPIHLHVNAMANESQGANWDAQTRLALAYLTIRPLAYMLMPGEDWVTLTYIDPNGEMKTSANPWRFYLQAPPPVMQGVHSGNASLHLGLDVSVLASNEFKSKAQKKPEGVPSTLVTEGVLRYGTVETSTGPCGYLRIFSFEVGDAAAFLKKVASILAELPQDRLIIDVRENPGGLIPSGQGLIRMLTTADITPAPIAFRSTSGTRALSQYPQFDEWESSLSLQTFTANVWSQSFPITTYYQNAPDYRYPGKTALIIDALCYSTTDFFAADFVDNKIGVVVGTDRQTGGGGANVWPWSVLVQFTDYIGFAGLQQLPAGYDLNISMRRAYRTGAAAGLPIEDLGVRADVQHRLTMRDLLEDNVDLLNFTAAQMA